MSNLLQTLLFTLAWCGGIGVLFLHLKNQKEEIRLLDIKQTFLLGAAIGLVAGLFGAFANLSHWFVYLLYIALGAFVTSRFVKTEPLHISYSRSMKEAEKKQDMILYISMSAINVLIFLTNYVFNNDLKAFMQVADKGWQIAGVVLHIASLLFLWALAKFSDGYGTIGAKFTPAFGWFLLIIAALLVSTGFNFDYFTLR